MSKNRNFASDYPQQLTRDLESVTAKMQDELADLGHESGISCLQIKIPPGGGLAYEVQGEEDGDVEYMKNIDAIIVFTHRANGFWPEAFGSGDDQNKTPVCSSMDGKTGLHAETGEVRAP